MHEHAAENNKEDLVPVQQSLARRRKPPAQRTDFVLIQSQLFRVTGISEQQEKKLQPVTG